MKRQITNSEKIIDNVFTIFESAEIQDLQSVNQIYSIAREYIKSCYIFKFIGLDELETLLEWVENLLETYEISYSD